MPCPTIKIRINLVGFFILCGFIFLPAQARGEEAVFLQITPGFRSLQLNWSPNSLEETENLVLICQENNCPQNFFDGQGVYRGNGNFWEDQKVLADRRYCYGAFKQDLSGQIVALGLAGPAAIQNMQEFLGALLTDNRIIFSGFILALILFWINKKIPPRHEKIRLDF